MILKASQRGGGQSLAVHLMRADDNEHIDLHELRGFASDNLKGAFREAEATAKGTRCRQYLFSLSLSPPAQANVSVDTFRETIDRIEKRLGLEGQPRALVFHEKEGRRHAHCVWSRIDADTMTAKQLSFFKTKLMGISRELYLEQGWEMPRGIEKMGQSNPLNFTLAEWQQAKRKGTDPRELRHAVQTSWKQSDGARAFARSLEDKGLFLAKGDRRAFVLLDHTGDVHALPRLLDLKTKEVRARLGDGADLPGLEGAKAALAKRMTPALRRHIAESLPRTLRRPGVSQRKAHPKSPASPRRSLGSPARGMGHRNTHPRRVPPQRSDRSLASPHRQIPASPSAQRERSEGDAGSSHSRARTTDRSAAR